MHFPTDRTAHTLAFDEPVVDHWLDWKIAQTANASAMQDWSVMQEDPNLYSKVLYHLSYVQPSGTNTYFPAWVDTFNAKLFIKELFGYGLWYELLSVAMF